MAINIYLLLNQIKYSLNANLPGQWAHKLMMPEGRIILPPHQSNPIPSAVLIALFEKDNQMYFPVIRRPVYNGHHSGQIGFPGGKFEKTDTNLTTTAIREAYEEIGIEPDDVVVLGNLTPLYIPITNMHVTPILAQLKTPPNYILNSFEVDELFNININEILNSANKFTENWDIRGNQTNVPFYHIHDQKIWGATAMILSELEQIIINCIP